MYKRIDCLQAELNSLIAECLVYKVLIAKASKDIGSIMFPYLLMKYYQYMADAFSIREKLNKEINVCIKMQ